MADEIVPDVPVSVGVADIPAKSVGRGTISVGDYVSFVGEDGMEQFGTVAGLVPSESGWLLQVVPDGGDVPMDLAVGDVKKAKRPVGDGAMTEPAAPLEGPNAEVVASLLSKLVAEFGQFIQSPDGTLVESEGTPPAEDAAPVAAAEEVAVGPVVDDMVMWMDDAGMEQSGVVVALMDGDMGQMVQVDPGDGVVVEVPVELVTVVPAEEPVAEVVEEVPVEEPVEVPMAARGRRRATARGRGTQTFPRGAPIRGEGGRFGGSEPGEPGDDAGGGGGGASFADTDMASGLDPAGDWASLEGPYGGGVDAANTESVFLNGGEVRQVYQSGDEYEGDAMVDVESMPEPYGTEAIEDTYAQMEELASPAPTEFTVTTTANAAEYSFDPETGNLVSPRGFPTDNQGLPFNSTPEAIVGYGNPTAAMEAAAENGDIPVQITVSEGTPIINGGVGQVAPESAGTAVMLPGNAKVTVTGMAVNPDTGQPMLLATATPRG
jgi:hypothetical protein